MQYPEEVANAVSRKLAATLELQMIRSPTKGGMAITFVRNER